MMFHCVDEAANLFRQHHRGPTYYYHYAYRGSLSTTAMAGVTADLGKQRCQFHQSHCLPTSLV